MLLGIGSTLSDIPTALPYIAFIGKMELQNLNFISVIAYFIVYTFIYILPLLIIQFLFTKKHSLVVAYFPKIEYWVDVLASWLIRVLLLIVVVILLIDVVLYFTNRGSFW